MIPRRVSLISNTISSSHDEKSRNDTSLHESTCFLWKDEVHCTNVTTTSTVLIERKRGCEPKQNKSVVKPHSSFEKGLEDPKVDKAKRGHCNVKATSGNDKPLGSWCFRARRSMDKIKNKTPTIGAGPNVSKKLNSIGRRINEKNFPNLRSTLIVSKPTMQSTDTAT